VDKTDHPTTPWASFCIATYRRPEILRATLVKIAEQTFENFEVIVSDNDPDQTSRPTVEAFGDARIRYSANQENLGMVKNFNVALCKASGTFIVMIADDDPPERTFLETMHDLSQSNPGYGAYLGACAVVMEDSAAASAYQARMGAIDFLADAPEGVVRCFSAEDFPGAYFKGRVFPYTLWSTCIVRRDIAVVVGGMPDYGSALLTDLSYIAAVGAVAGCATINRVVGAQVVHGANSGLVNPHDVEAALIGCHSYLVAQFSARPDAECLARKYNAFLARYMANHSVAMHAYLSANGTPEDIAALRDALQRMSKLPYMGRLRSYHSRAALLALARRQLWFLVPSYKWLRRHLRSYR
jgi:glycosyltransferase involved in cell wall biosynthesis